MYTATFSLYAFILLIYKALQHGYNTRQIKSKNDIISPLATCVGDLNTVS